LIAFNDLFDFAIAFPMSGPHCGFESKITPTSFIWLFGEILVSSTLIVTGAQSFLKTDASQSCFD
jgi:hypothetical protein